jgi:hypothetical protein
MGGNGGLAGDGGNATGGTSGNGGRGGDGSPAGIGGGPGVLGVAHGGAGGTGGAAGAGGLGSGTPGSSGGNGSATNGAFGTTGLAGTFCLEAATWTNTGFSLAGTGGVAPMLFGVGSLLPSSSNSLLLFQARPSAPAVVFVSLGVLAVKFKGGWLIPAPDLAVILQTTPAGGIELPFAMPGGQMLPVTLLHIQFWIQDPGGPANLSASNSLRARIP